MLLSAVARGRFCRSAGPWFCPVVVRSPRRLGSVGARSGWLGWLGPLFRSRSAGLRGLVLPVGLARAVVRSRAGRSFAVGGPSNL